MLVLWQNKENTHIHHTLPTLYDPHLTNILPFYWWIILCDTQIRQMGMGMGITFNFCEARHIFLWYYCVFKHNFELYKCFCIVILLKYFPWAMVLFRNVWNTTIYILSVIIVMVKLNYEFISIGKFILNLNAEQTIGWHCWMYTINQYVDYVILKSIYSLLYRCYNLINIKWEIGRLGW